MRSYFLIHFWILHLCVSGNLLLAQEENVSPKLVVGIVVDQMRYDYLEKYWNKFGEDGFKRLVKQGCNFTLAKYDYIPTYTGPGHATIYAGVPPSMHGICANDWPDQNMEMVYCVQDKEIEELSPVILGGISPKNLVTDNLSDLFKKANGTRSRVISISLKDRAAVLPAGKLADQVYWFDSKSGNFVTSSYYAKELPFYVQDFNQQGHVDRLLNRKWESILPLDQYVESGPDGSIYEAEFYDGSGVTFPYDLIKMKERLGYKVIKSTPFGNTLTRDMAMTAFTAENLGRNEGSDLLLVSFSSTDYIGHQFGPQSVELEDTYIRLDIDLAQMINQIEGTLGKDKVLFMLTSDHGVVDVPQFLLDQNKAGGYYSEKKLKDSLNQLLLKRFGIDFGIARLVNNNLYLTSQLLNLEEAELKEALESITGYLIAQPFVDNVVDLTSKAAYMKNNELVEMTVKGAFPGRSGQLAFTTKSGWIDFGRLQGTTHGSGHDYDTHVPLLFYGWKVIPKTINQPTFIEQIMPTLAKSLNLKTQTQEAYPALEICE